MGIRHVLGKLPYAGSVRRARHLEAADHDSPQMHIPGHYYSPVPDLRLVRADRDRIFANERRELPGIDLREKAQLALLEEFATYYG